MKTIAVVGGGISGLMSAYLLSRRYTVWLFEQDGRLGGHTNTIRIDTPEGPVALDTGFLVHNTRTYPNLVRVFTQLGIATKPSDMSFSVACPVTGLEYSSRGVLGFFAQPANLARPEHYRLLLDIARFNREAPRLMSHPEAEHWTLESFVDREGYSRVFVERYLVPMTSAIWSAPVSAMRAFPIRRMVTFMQNHGMLSMGTQLIWRVVTGGSDTYIKPMIAPLADRVRTASPVVSIRRDDRGVEIVTADQQRQRFDEVVLACHGDRVLGLLAEPTADERQVFGAFRTTPNEAILHSDARLLPQSPRARASWNYRLADDPDRPPSVTYDLNRLQGLACKTQYCVTLNPHAPIDESRVIRRIHYRHPQFTVDTDRAQAQWNLVSGVNRTHYAGAYWRYGFHEDGALSAVRVAESLGVSW